MSDDAERKVPVEMLKLGIKIEADYLDALSEEEVGRELDADIASLSPLDQKRLEKAADRFKKNLAALIDGEKAKLVIAGGSGLKAAAEDGDAASASTLKYAPLNRLFEISGRTYGVGVATSRPREIVLLGEMLRGAVALRIGREQFNLVSTSDPTVTRCRGLGEPQLKLLLDVGQPPTIEIVVRSE